MTMASETSRGVRSSTPAVIRAAELLGVLAEPGVSALGPTDLARALHLPKSSVAGLIDALDSVGFVRRIDGKCELGPRLFELGAAYSARTKIINRFLEAAARPRFASQETMQLATLEGAEVVYIARHDGMQPVRLLVGIGRRVPANCAALGKAMLAQLSDDEIAARMTMPTWPVLTPHSKRNLPELMEDLDLTRARGYAIDYQETTIGMICYGIALPVAGPTSDRRAISVTLLNVRATPELEEHLVDDLRSIASELSR
jgi:DNA-binding IclR family transcriptional regulator